MLTTVFLSTLSLCYYVQKLLHKHFESDSLIIEWTEAKFLVPDWGIKSTLAQG